MYRLSGFMYLCLWKLDMFDDLKAAWLIELYKTYKGVLLPSVNDQLSNKGLFLDLDSLPSSPVPFKELFIKWLISVNRSRIERGDGVIITKEVVLACPLWRMVKCPLRSIKLTKEGMFNKPRTTTKTIGTKGPVGSINR